MKFNNTHKILRKNNAKNIKSIYNYNILILLSTGFSNKSSSGYIRTYYNYSSLVGSM